MTVSWLVSNSFQLLTIVTMSTTLDAAEVLDSSGHSQTIVIILQRMFSNKNFRNTK